MKLTEQLTDYIHAAFTGFWVQTHEPDEAERELVQHAQQQKWKIAVWDMAAGLRIPGNINRSTQETGASDPLAALRALPALADPDGTAIFVLHNFHRFLSNPEVIQTVFSQLIAGNQQRTFLVVLSPLVQIPVELEKLFVVLEHAFPGSQDDSGVSTRLFGNLLTWLSGHESDVFFIATSNDISKLPPEFTRAERFDAVFFLDLPNIAEKDTIWSLYRNHFGIPESQTRPDDSSWTGAEIKSCCRLAALLEVSLMQAARNIVPVAVTAAESVERLRTWASGRCLCATIPGIYSRDRTPVPKPSRRIKRDPSDN